MRVQIVVPGESEGADVFRIDIVERTEALLRVVAAVGQPVVALAGCGLESRLVDRLVRGLTRASAKRDGGGGEQQGGARPSHRTRIHADSPCLHLPTPPTVRQSLESRQGGQNNQPRAEPMKAKEMF